MSFLSIIGKRFRDAGLHDVLVEAGIVAGSSINGVLEGKHYNRSMNAHKLMFEALYCLKLKAFYESQTEETQQKLNLFFTYLADQYPSQLSTDLSSSEEFQDVVTMLNEFDKQQCMTHILFGILISKWLRCC
ncbi:hypothetical protein SNE40_014140 [Patella caerulea]|uniref:Uncharacterized protein n=1 Tax=Patella caerulea TaxID=87958 RepID=A0AAN8JDX9_PATCE